MHIPYGDLPQFKQVPCAGLAALCATAARVRSIAEALSSGEAAACPHAALPISLLHACLAHLPLWLQSAPGPTGHAARDSLSQVRPCACANASTGVDKLLACVNQRAISLANFLTVLTSSKEHIS